MTTKKENSDKATPPPIPLSTDEILKEQFQPMEGDASLANTFGTLLKKPGSLIHSLIHGDSKKLGSNLAITAVVCLAVFGLILGLFSGGTQLWAAPLKIVLGVLISGLITLPSLYIFSCLNGLDVTAKSVSGVLAACLSLISLLLLGLAPVAWIFSQSTDSKAFMGFLTLTFWTISLWFGLSLISKPHECSG